jgi:hypothetical protein
MSTLAQRLVAVLVLVVAGWILLKLVVGLVAGLATFLVAIVAVVAIVWAVRTL